MIPSKAVRGELLRPRDVAKWLNISLSIVYSMADHEIPVHHIRGSIRFDSADVDDYLFFSKFYHSNLKLSAIDKEQLRNRFEDQIDHLRRYIQKFIGETKKPPKKEP